MPKRSVIRWLLDSDPAIRWHVMRDLTDAPAEEVAVERARVATEGVGAQLLALQGIDGRWGGAAWNRGWNSTMHVLMLLREIGLDPASEEARRAVGRVRDRVTWKGCGPQQCDGNPFFAGEVEPCINGQVAAVGASLDRTSEASSIGCSPSNCPMAAGTARLRTAQRLVVQHHDLRAGGPARVPTTVREQSGNYGGPSPGAGYLLERRLFRRRSTGEVIERDRKSGEAFTRFAFPTWWHYDVLRGLEYLCSAGDSPNERVAEAIDLVKSKRDGDGRWPLETRYPGVMPLQIDDGEGRPSRWNTLRASRVLNWYSPRE